MGTTGKAYDEDHEDCYCDPEGERGALTADEVVRRDDVPMRTARVDKGLADALRDAARAGEISPPAMVKRGGSS